MLEQLSNTLELNIQDLVTGEVSGNCTEAVTEIARVARIQEKEKRKKIVVSGMVSMIFILLLITGLKTFDGYPMFSIAFYYFFMAVVLSMLSVKCIFDDYIVNPFQRKTGTWCVIFSIVTGIYAVASVLITMALVNHGITPFHMDVNSVGPFVNWQLVLVFIINSICLASECVRVVVAEQGVHIGIYMIVFNIFLTMIYSNLLHRLVSLQEFNRAFILDTAAIAVEAIILFGLMLLFKRVLKKKV